VNYNSRPQFQWTIYIYIYNQKNQKSFKKIVIFKNIFPTIFHNIGLYVYTVKYKFNIKILGFLQNISKKIKNFKTFAKKKKIFCCIRPNPEIFPSIFFIKKQKLHLFHVFKKSKNRYRNQFMIIH